MWMLMSIIWFGQKQHSLWFRPHEAKQCEGTSFCLCHRRASGTSCTSVLNFAETSCVLRVMISRSSAQYHAANWGLVCLNNTIPLSASKQFKMLKADFNACWNVDSVDLMHMPCEEFTAYMFTMFTRNLEQYRHNPDQIGWFERWLFSKYIMSQILLISLYIIQTFW